MIGRYRPNERKRLERFNWIRDYACFEAIKAACADELSDFENGGEFGLISKSCLRRDDTVFAREHNFCRRLPVAIAQRDVVEEPTYCGFAKTAAKHYPG